MKKLLIGILCVLALAACGPAEVGTTPEAIASAIPSLPPELEASAQALADEAEALASGLNELAESGDLDAAASALAAAAADIESLVDQYNVPLQLQSDQPLVLDTTQEIAGVTNYKWTIAEAPEAASGVVGQVISENSNGKLTVDPADYARYFPASGEYRVDLELTFEGGTTQTVPIPVVVP